MKVETKKLTIFNIDTTERILLFIDKEYSNIFLYRDYNYKDEENESTNFYTEDDRDYSYCRISFNSIKKIISLYKRNLTCIKENVVIFEDNEVFISSKEDGSLTIGEFDFFLKQHGLYNEDDKWIHFNFCFEFYNKKDCDDILNFISHEIGN